MGDGSGTLRIFFKCGERLLEMAFKCANAVGYAVMERLFTVSQLKLARAWRIACLLFGKGMA